MQRSGADLVVHDSADSAGEPEHVLDSARVRAAIHAKPGALEREVGRDRQDCVNDMQKTALGADAQAVPDHRLKQGIVEEMGGGDGDDVVEKSIGEIQLGAIHHTEAHREPHTRLFNVVGIDVDATPTRSVSGS